MSILAATIAIALAFNTTTIQADVTDNLSNAIVTVLNKIATSIGQDNSKPTVQTSLTSLKSELEKVNKSLEKISTTQSMTSASSVKFENASWKAIHSVLKASSLEDYTWSVGDTKMMGTQKVVITKITYNADGTPDEIDIGMTKAVTKTGINVASAWCKDEAWKQADTLTSITGLGKAGHLPEYEEIPASAGADKHITNKSYLVSYGYPDYYYGYYYSDGSQSETLYYYFAGYSDSYPARTDYYSVSLPVCPVITIH